MQRYNAVCYMTPYRPLAARTDDLYQIVYYLNFYTPPETYLPRLKNNNNTGESGHPSVKRAIRPA